MSRRNQLTLHDVWNCQPVTSVENGAENASDDFDDAADELLSFALSETLRNVGSEIRSVDMSKVDSVAGFDMEAGKTWIYPSNMPYREYQYKISRQALFYNTLVTLPTGLGKTFIAAVVMYNFYRWYPNGKVIFMAPTKPLVAQQVEACFSIMGIPQEDVAEMTGSKLPAKRRDEWSMKRIFFLTPQVMANDLSRSACPAKQIKCVVVDEAHRATGNHSYCQVIRDLLKYTKQFRVLALSATPGPDIQTVQQVIANLLIHHLEIRVEDSPDIRPYTFERQIEKIVVPMPPETSRIVEEYVEVSFTQCFLFFSFSFQVLNVYINSLTSEKILYARNIKHYSKCFILQQREKFRQSVDTTNVTRAYVGNIERQFALLLSLYHGYELMTMHGLKSLYHFLLGNTFVSFFDVVLYFNHRCAAYLDRIFGEQGNTGIRRELLQNSNFCTVYSYLRDNFERPIDDDFMQCKNFDEKLNFAKECAGKSHPKLVKLIETLVDHFERCNSGKYLRKAIIFTSFRDSVAEIATLLKSLSPLIKPVKFIGQNLSRGAAKGITQKEQLNAVQGFQKGDYNTLVATCVGEEGLDIGEVDLIVCYDAPTSPVRLVQRMGRTGRQRVGRVISLVSTGKEEQVRNEICSETIVDCNFIDV
ncbi:unnamed protein product [Soboliphyme baturini]|uniref:Fanconi anemia group M protein n=1 Tax=Soboliphyme baturini TaxID=241478 RepID=A0A183IRY3_9BILA|nr:unnamed protein product [Soboliphyme baturini]